MTLPTPAGAASPITPDSEPGIPGRRSPANRKLRLINLGAVVVPFGAVVAAFALTWGDWFDWTQASIFAGMLVVTALGITIGYHRLATHSSFQTYAFVRYVFAVFGSMAAQGPVIEWAATHRRHHQHSDDEHDPHSPHTSGVAGVSWGRGFVATLRGVYHSHMGWLFAGHLRGLGRYTKDLRADRALCAADRQFVWWVLAGLALPALLGGLITVSITGAVLGLLWGGLVRMFVCHHITWSVNSVCHLWGTSPFRSHDHSRNNALIGVLAFGEGWHNNHHAFPTSARHGFRWWEFDSSYLVIRVLEAVGLAWRVRTPSADRLLARRLRSAD